MSRRLPATARTTLHRIRSHSRMLRDIHDLVRLIRKLALYERLAVATRVRATCSRDLQNKTHELLNSPIHRMMNTLRIAMHLRSSRDKFDTDLKTHCDAVSDRSNAMLLDLARRMQATLEPNNAVPD